MKIDCVHLIGFMFSLKTVLDLTEIFVVLVVVIMKFNNNVVLVQWKMYSILLSRSDIGRVCLVECTINASSLELIHKTQ
jgi:hypothetical protein